MPLYLDVSDGRVERDNYGLFTTLDFRTALDRGDPIILGSGTYDLSGWTTYSPTAPISIIGSGNTVLQFDNSSTVVFKTTSSIVLSGLTFAGCGSVLQSDAAESGSADLLSIDRCTFSAIDSPIAIERPFNRFVATNNRFLACLNDAIRLGKNDFTLQDTWVRGTITGNEFLNLQATSSNACRATIVYGKDMIWCNNTVSGVTGLNANEVHGFYSKARQTVAEGNTIRGVSAGTVSSGITIKGRPRGDTSDPQGYSCTVEGNTIEGDDLTQYCIRVDSGEVTIVGNPCSQPLLTAIDVASDLTSSVSIVGNECCGHDLTSSIGIASNTDGANILIASNLIGDFKKGIKVGATTTTLTGVVISANNIAGAATHGIELSPSVATSDVSITNNVIKTTGNQGIRINGTGAITGLVIANNRITTAQYGIVSDAGVAIANMEAYGNHVTSTGTLGRELTWTAGLMPIGFAINQVYRCRTTSATVVYPLEWPMTDAHAAHVEVSVLAMKTDGTSRASYHKVATFIRSGAGAALQGTMTSLHEQESVAGWDVALLAHPTNTNNLALALTGAASTTIDWVVSVKAVGL